MSWFRVGLIAGSLILPLALNGCIGLLVVGGLGAAAGSGYAASQERGVDGTADDFTIKTNIERDMITANPNLQSGVTTTVYNGRVLLTGHLPDAQMKASAEQIASRETGVHAVYNEIEVAPFDVWDDAQDTWITTRVRSEMVVDTDVRSVNYTIDTANGSVYLIGSARSQDELDRATRIARYVPGVKRVVSYVELRTGAPVAAIPGSPATAPGPPSMPSAAPNNSIEVRKL